MSLTFSIFSCQNSDNFTFNIMKKKILTQANYQLNISNNYVVKNKTLPMIPNNQLRKNKPIQTMTCSNVSRICVQMDSFLFLLTRFHFLGNQTKIEIALCFLINQELKMVKKTKLKIGNCSLTDKN